MIQEISKVESVGSEAVQACVAHLESLLEKIIHSAEKQAELDRVNTIKPRHLEAAIGLQVDENTSDDDVSSQVEEDVLDAHVKGSALTPNAIRGIAKSFAGMPITDDAVEELLLLYYDVVDETEENIRKHAQLGSNSCCFYSIHRSNAGINDAGMDEADAQESVSRSTRKRIQTN